MKEKWTELREKWFEGEVTLSKVTLWLACAACLLAGIVYGLRKAPWTHGVAIGSNNGNNNGNNSGNGKINGGEEDDEAVEEKEKSAAGEEKAKKA